MWERLRRGRARWQQSGLLEKGGVGGRGLRECGGGGLRGRTGRLAAQGQAPRALCQELGEAGQRNLSPPPRAANGCGVLPIKHGRDGGQRLGICKKGAGTPPPGMRRSPVLKDCGLRGALV